MKKLVFGICLTALLLLMVNPAGAAVSYQVKNGDTLWNISRTFDVPVSVIIRENNLSSPYNLYVGQRLIISSSDSDVVITIENSADSMRTNSYIYYVKSGDTLWEIANRFNTTVEEILSANRDLDYSYQLYIGQRLVIPVETPSDDYDDGYDGGYDNDDNGGSYNDYGQVYRNGYATYYIVKPGDILWNIARRFNTTVSRLIDLNNISDSYDLYPGRQLIVWLADYSSPVTNPPDYNRPDRDDDSDDDSDNHDREMPERAAYAPYYLYTVQRGDTLNAIARQFGVRVSILRNANSTGRLNTPGRVLVIPLESTERLEIIRDLNWKFNNYYQVRNHESLADIAGYFGLSEDGLRAINNLEENQSVLNHQVLLMPVSSYLLGRYRVYTTEEDTTPQEVAVRLNASLEDVLKANYMRNQNYPLKAGTSMLIPSA